MSRDWRVVTEEAYFDALEILPPAFQDHRGFLVGEVTDHRICTITGPLTPDYAAYVRIGDTCYGGPNLTINEFRKLDLAAVPQRKQ